MPSERGWLELFLPHGLIKPDFTAYLLQITHGETLWCRDYKKAPTKKRTCPIHDEPNDADPPLTGKPSTGCAPAEFWIPWAELIGQTVGVDQEICTCGARMIVDDAITDGEKIANVLARLGRRCACFNGSTQEAAING